MTELDFLKIYEDKDSDLKYKKRRLASSLTSLEKLRDIFDKQAVVLYKEKSDVEGLEKLSVKNLFAKITNRMDEAIEKEEQEYIEAKVKYEELQNSISQTEKEIRSLQSDIGFLERELRSLKDDGRKQFANIDERFTAVESEIIQLQSEVKELDEAIESGERVCATVQSAISKLEKARGWATYDMFTSGGLISHMAKYGNIDEAQEIIKEIGYRVDKFRTELKDVNISFQGDFSNYNGTTRFVDFFFDNIFTDLSVRNRLEDDINRLNDLRSGIMSIKNDLINSKKSTLNKISSLV